MTEGLNQVGLPFCNGFVMATNPMWRKTRSQWREQISGWIRRSEGNFLRLCDIFFDFVCVYGDGQFSTELRQHIAANAARPVFLRELYKVDEEHDVALGPFGWWFLTERQPGPNKGKINLKQTGTLPLINAVRVLSLRYQVTATSTLARIDALRASKALSADEQDGLSGGYRHITHLLLRQQLNDAAAGRQPGNHVPKNALSKREKTLLVDSFKAIKSLR